MILASFLVGLVVALAASAYAVVRGVALWRQAKSSGSAFTDELARFEERAERTELLLTEAEQANQNLQAAVERFRVSRARLQVLLDSLENSKRRTRWLHALLPLR